MFGKNYVSLMMIHCDRILHYNILPLNEVIRKIAAPASKL